MKSRLQSPGLNTDSCTSFSKRNRWQVLLFGSHSSQHPEDLIFTPQHCGTVNNDKRDFCL